jgi:hypothetical protein
MRTQVKLSTVLATLTPMKDRIKGYNPKEMAINKIKPSPVLTSGAAYRFAVMSNANEQKSISQEERRRMDDLYAKVMKNSKLK